MGFDKLGYLVHRLIARLHRPATPVSDQLPPGCDQNPWRRRTEDMAQYGRDSKSALSMAELRDRMPVILAPQDWPLWPGEIEGVPVTML